MHIFISAVFFLFFFSLIYSGFGHNENETLQPTYSEVKSEIENKIEEIRKNIKDKENPDFVRKRMGNQVKLLQQDVQTLSTDTTHLSNLNYFKVKELSAIFGQYKDVAQYDSVQNSLPAKDRNSWMESLTTRKIIQIQSKYNYDDKELLKAFFEKFRHSFPQLLFVSLPLFALLLKLLYLKEKRFFYADHIIFSVHLYSAMFILQFIILAVSQIEDFKYLHWLQVFTVPFAIYAVWYQYKSLRNFYDESRSKTIIKYILLLIMSLVVMSLLFVAFLALSVFNL